MKLLHDNILHVIVPAALPSAGETPKPLTKPRGPAPWLFKIVHPRMRTRILPGWKLPSYFTTYLAQRFSAELHRKQKAAPDHPDTWVILASPATIQLLPPGAEPVQDPKFTLDEGTEYICLKNALRKPHHFHHFRPF